MEKHMLNDPGSTPTSRERLSALLDGELDPHGVRQACDRWRDDADSRSTWHAYRLIGDTLRSDDLAGDAAGDAAFLAAFRSRMSLEPVVLAPRPPETSSGEAASTPGRFATRSGRWAWFAPTAVAAGFVAVAGVLTLTRPGSFVGPDTAADAVAQATVPALVAASTARSPDPAATPDAQTFVASGQLIRDARLDRYLAAHKQFAGSSALGVPSSNLRNATVEAAGRP